MIVEPEKLDATQYALQYEQLRSQVIGSAGNVIREDPPGQTRGVGLAVLLSEGTPGWLKAVEGVLRASLVSCADDSPDPSLHAFPPQYSAVPAWFSSVQRHEVTALLASLVLSTRPVAHQVFRGGYR